MKSVFIHNQIGYTIEVKKDQLKQGESFLGNVYLKNHSIVRQELSALSLELAVGDLKSVKEKKDTAFSSIESNLHPLKWESVTLEPQKEWSSEFTCSLDSNCPISDKFNSLFILFGTGESRGQLLLNVVSHPMIIEIIKVLESGFQFVSKGAKYAKGRVEIKLKPSSARRFSSIDEVVMRFRNTSNALDIEYRFKIKEFVVGSMKGEISKGTKEFAQSLPLKLLQPTENYFDHGFIERQLEMALDTVATTV